MHYNMTVEEQAEHVRRVKAADVGQSNGHAPPVSAARPSLDSQVLDIRTSSDVARDFRNDDRCRH